MTWVGRVSGAANIWTRPEPRSLIKEKNNIAHHDQHTAER
jgi:hypothetical protein